MKKIFALILAVCTVLSASLLILPASANSETAFGAGTSIRGSLYLNDDPVEPVLPDYTWELGSATVPYGSDKAYVEIRLRADVLPEGCKRLRDWQITFECGHPTDGTVFYGSTEDTTVYSFVNKRTCQIGATTEPGECIATAEQLLSGESVLLATVCFAIDPTAEPGSEFDVYIGHVDELTFENEDFETFSLKDRGMQSPGFITVEGRIGVSPYADGMENWKNSPNKGDMDAVTQILFCPDPWNAECYTPGMAVTVNMKALDGTSDDTFEATVATVYDGGDWGICRIEPCLLETPWIPVKDASYTATFTFMGEYGETVTVQAEGAYVLHEDPIVPGPSVLFGDVNGDGKINKKDSLDLKKYLADDSYEIDLDAADVVPDGKVNKKDALRLKQYLAGWDAALGA